VENNSNQEQPSVQSLIDSLTRNKGFIKQWVDKRVIFDIPKNLVFLS
jgi:hypothetical protein